jgi:hypothetical protein
MVQPIDVGLKDGRCPVITNREHWRTVPSASSTVPVLSFFLFYVVLKYSNKVQYSCTTYEVVRCTVLVHTPPVYKYLYSITENDGLNEEQWWIDGLIRMYIKREC